MAPQNDFEPRRGPIVTSTHRQGAKLSIGQMARLNRVSEKALRIYQAHGILQPDYVDETTGYRFYTLEQCAALDSIKQMQDVGFSLDEISEVLAASDVASLREKVRTHVLEVEGRIRELSMAHQVGADLLRSCEAMLNKPPLLTPSLQTVEERHILEFDLGEVDPSDPDASGDTAMGKWELDLRSVKRRIEERSLPESLFRNVGCIVRKEDLLAGRIIYKTAFVFVTPAFGQRTFSLATTIPACTCLVEYIDGTLTPDGRELETVELERLLERCESMGLEPAGDYRGEVIADGPAFLYEGRGMLFRMCLPVRLKGQADWTAPSQRELVGAWRVED